MDLIKIHCIMYEIFKEYIKNTLNIKKCFSFTYPSPHTWKKGKKRGREEGEGRGREGGRKGRRKGREGTELTGARVTPSPPLELLLVLEN